MTSATATSAATAAPSCGRSGSIGSPPRGSASPPPTSRPPCAAPGDPRVHGDRRPRRGPAHPHLRGHGVVGRPRRRGGGRPARRPRRRRRHPHRLHERQRLRRLRGHRVQQRTVQRDQPTTRPSAPTSPTSFPSACATFRTGSTAGRHHWPSRCGRRTDPRSPRSTASWSSCSSEVLTSARRYPEATPVTVISGGRRGFPP